MDYLKFLCHRRPERSFFVKGHQFPVCARCTGFYSGLIAYLIFIMFYPIHYDMNLFIISIILMIPTGIDGFTQFLGLRESNNTLRFTTGFIGGIGLIIFLKMIIKWGFTYVL